MVSIARKKFKRESSTLSNSQPMSVLDSQTRKAKRRDGNWQRKRAGEKKVKRSRDEIGERKKSFGRMCVCTYVCVREREWERERERGRDMSMHVKSLIFCIIFLSYMLVDIYMYIFSGRQCSALMISK